MSAGCIASCAVVFRQFDSLVAAPRELWILYVLKLLESFAYFSLSYVLVLYLSEEFGYSDQAAGWVYGFFGMLISLYGVLVGFVIDQLGVKRSLVLGSVLLLIARFIIAWTRSNAVLELMLLVLLPVGEAFGVPVMLVALRRYTNDQNRRQAFSLFYVVMNVGTLLSTPAVDIFRLAIADGITVRIAGTDYLFSAYRMLLFVCSAVTVLMLLVASFGMREIEATTDRAPHMPRPRREPPWRATYLVMRERRFWRFFLFVVLLVGVRLTFRHLDATFPKYMVRQFGASTPYGSVIAINPLLIIVTLPAITAYTLHISAFQMILVGSWVSAASVFVLVVSSTYASAVLFIVLLSIGEALWSPRLYEYTAMIAPKGREGTYMALASAPNFAAKLAVGGLSGTLLAELCPSEGHCNGKTMWLMVGLMTLSSPVLMLLLRRYIEPDDITEDSHRAQAQAQQRAAQLDADGDHAEKEGLLTRERAEGSAKPAAITSATQRGHASHSGGAEC